MPGTESIIRPRRGIFGVLMAKGHILVTWPDCAPDVPELPGGGIEAGESCEQALIREIEEEADIGFESLKPARELERLNYFYADNSREFWDYDQIYWTLSGAAIEAQFFTGYRKPADALKSGWVPLENIHSIGLHAVHAKVLKEVWM